MKSDAQVIRELGLHHFKAVCQKDESFTFSSPTPNNVLDSDTKSYFCTVVSGSFLFENDNGTPMTFKATKRRMGDGIVFPGSNKLTALEDDSVYCCISVLPQRFLKEDFHAMYEMKHEFLEAGQSRTLRFADSELVLLSMGVAGEAIVTEGENVKEVTFEDGQRLAVPVEGEIVFTATTTGHLVVVVAKPTAEAAQA